MSPPPISNGNILRRTLIVVIFPTGPTS
ncbi:hypothetical protein M6B38_172015 [Iris pallida]|uniref:Uncharacterized protein n=1 Tax=Iris pallida TaxID=29817 RepID=A0AAX6DGV1_IRIPA|nr:hypothetical protein M6B38_246255 [Iris pallida]KAJ6807325.1 hypothetical protein M6B38_172015 [Iris pallida]